MIEKLEIKKASKKDIDFIIESIIAAEKNNTEILSYSKIFNLKISKVKEILKQTLLFNVDGCELSISSYLIGFIKNKPVASVGAWVEGKTGLPSSTIKGNLLFKSMPTDSIKYAKSIFNITSKLYTQYILNSFCIGIVYIKKNYRGYGIFKKILEIHINNINKGERKMNTYVHVFSNNISAIKTYEKNGFVVIKEIKSDDNEIKKYLPFNKKQILIKKTDD
tara:strand:- start:76035 stop:76697 length:663 start_codon:yes stop_codon:yes gene_type:complete